MFVFLESLRPTQWTKNLIVFAGLIFSQNFLNVPLLVKTIAAFVLFCAVSSGVYLINDLADLKGDRNHPKKSKRPLASGRLKASVAVLSAVILVLFSLGSSIVLNPLFAVTIFAYFLLQLAYIFYLKSIVIIDVSVIAAGFVLRAVGGAVAINVQISSWLIICTILLALFLGFSKRRHELVILEKTGPEHRPVLQEYGTALLDQMIAVVTPSTVLAYALYTTSEETISKFHTRNLIYTIPFVLYGIFRYLYLIYKKDLGGSPERILLTDKPLIANMLLYAIAVGIILYV
jgi:4-hydroxybenzoate polyprenyltransferase